ncbi:MAG: hypothetical protein M3256_17995 [Actinomycetota bacterium]|nr:hypothetical protein [Actinomycetota bacterium]
MDVHMGSRREAGVGFLRRTLLTLAGLMLAGLTLAGIAVAGLVPPAGAAPPFPNGAQASALVSGTPLVEARCPSGPTVSGGTSTRGPVTVGMPAGARCTSTSAAADGLYSIAGATPVPPRLRFQSDCVNSGANNGFADVPAGTNVAGVGVVSTTTPVTTPNTAVTYPDGTTAIVNEVITTPTSVQRSAVHITSGAASGTIIGRVICGAANVYPLAADTAGATNAAPALAANSVSNGGGSSNTRLLLLAGGVLALLVLAQVTVGRTMWRRRRGLTGS